MAVVMGKIVYSPALICCQKPLRHRLAQALTAPELIERRTKFCLGDFSDEQDMVCAGIAD
jgi:hypothetical protein